MNLKYYVLNKIADKLEQYKSNKETNETTQSRYDKVSDYLINGEVITVYVNADEDYYDKSLNNTKGQIYLKEILDKEYEYEFNIKDIKISFHNDENLICIDNPTINQYLEPIHECFERGYGKTYIKCDDKKSFNGAKEYILQNEKFHECIVVRDEIPCKKIYDEVFKPKVEKKIVVEDEKKNYIQIEGRIENIGKVFTKKDGEKAQYIDIVQEYEYKNKKYNNKFSVMLDNYKIQTYKYDLKKDDTILIKGTLNSYIDKNKQNNFVIKPDHIAIKNEKEQEIAGRKEN